MTESIREATGRSRDMGKSKVSREQRSNGKEQGYGKEQGHPARRSDSAQGTDCTAASINTGEEDKGATVGSRGSRYPYGENRDPEGTSVRLCWHKTRLVDVARHGRNQ